jgi:hypothetical protein
MSGREGKLYVDLIIQIVYQHGCVTRKKLIDVIVEKTGKPRKTVENSVAKRVASLVKSGIIEKPRSGIYCKPGILHEKA